MPCRIILATFGVAQAADTGENVDSKAKVWPEASLALLAGYLSILPPITQALLWIMLADLSLEVLADIKLKRLSRAAMYEKVTASVTILILIGVAVVLNPHVQPFVGLDLVLSSSYAYLVWVLTSITHNAAILNVPIFNQAQDVLRYFNAAAGAKVDGAKATSETKPE